MLSFNKVNRCYKKISFRCFPCSDLSKYGSAGFDVPDDHGVLFPDVWFGHAHGPVPAVKLGAMCI